MRFSLLTLSTGNLLRRAELTPEKEALVKEVKTNVDGWLLDEKCKALLIKIADVKLKTEEAANKTEEAANEVAVEATAAADATNVTEVGTPADATNVTEVGTAAEVPVVDTAAEVPVVDTAAEAAEGETPTSSVSADGDEIASGEPEGVEAPQDVARRLDAEEDKPVEILVRCGFMYVKNKLGDAEIDRKMYLTFLKRVAEEAIKLAVDAKRAELAQATTTFLPEVASTEVDAGEELVGEVDPTEVDPSEPTDVDAGEELEVDAQVDETLPEGTPDVERQIV